MNSDSMTKQERNVNRRVGTYSVPTGSSLTSAWAKKHAHPTPELQTELDRYLKGLGYGA